MNEKYSPVSFPNQLCQIGTRKHIRSQLTADETSKDLPKVHFQVRISKVVGLHQCTPHTPTHQIAMQNSGTHVIDLEKFLTVIADPHEDIT